ncbi:uncharacterized protein LY89DRAFT_506280 [Mollisia scopiformis]|uniref:Uncharacterized protein n=1 Tax=Mollisia scopiformis TaxID=149040 RepID=A0A194XF84_MOLSC|nr:uncharacterized protein LY89DRAFT_506280 [Mollisia scopiformis]KUJ18855.1 hypothetical protein LY89DRAFT_506280 [Mollisia scopiformis]
MRPLPIFREAWKYRQWLDFLDWDDFHSWGFLSSGFSVPGLCLTLATEVSSCAVPEFPKAYNLEMQRLCIDGQAYPCYLLSQLFPYFQCPVPH